MEKDTASDLTIGDRVRTVNVPSEFERKMSGAEPTEAVGIVVDIVEDDVPMSDTTLELAVIETEDGEEKRVNTSYLNNELDSEEGGVTIQVLDEDDEDEDEDDDDDETETEGSTDDTTSTQELVTDGGEEIRDRQEVEQSGDQVRQYSADGTLYAYRVGDEHVVVSKGREPATTWEKRVPAERTAVTTGEKLWTIPDNWELRLTVNETDVNRSAIYRIPDSGVHVRVSVPTKTHLVDAWYHVKAVGDVVVEYDGTFDREALMSFLAELEDEGSVDEDVLDVLRVVERGWSTFARQYREDVNTYAEESFWNTFEGGRLDGWSANPWGDIYDVEYQLSQFCDVDFDVAASADELLRESGAISSYPPVRVSVAAREGLPASFDVRALIEAGCSPAEAVDYVMTEIVGESQSSWAEARGKHQSTVSGNVSQARQILDS